MRLMDKVAGVIDSDVESAKIEHVTGVPRQFIEKMRLDDDNFDDNVKNIDLGTAERLGSYYDASMIDLAVNASNDDRLMLFKPRLGQLFQEILDDQLAISKSDEGQFDDYALTAVLQLLFKDTMNDNTEIGRLVSEYQYHLRTDD